MTFAELVAQVILETNRPDYGFVSDGGGGEIPAQVASSTRKMHTLEYFAKDILSSQAVFDTAAYIQTLDTRTMPFFRNMAYFRKNDPSQSQYQQNPTLLPPLYSLTTGINIWLGSKLLTPIVPDALFDDYGAERFDVYYQLGDTLMIKSSTPLSYALLGWYAHPNTNPADNYAQYNSWIAKEYPDAIYYDAASAILQKTGMTDAARKYDYFNPQDPLNCGLAISASNRLKMNNIQVQGY